MHIGYNDFGIASEPEGGATDVERRDANLSRAGALRIPCGMGRGVRGRSAKSN